MAASAEMAQTLQDVTERKYKYGFVTDIESETAPKGLDEEVIRFISAKKGEPDWLQEFLRGMPLRFGDIIVKV